MRVWPAPCTGFWERSRAPKSRSERVADSALKRRCSRPRFRKCWIRGEQMCPHPLREFPAWPRRPGPPPIARVPERPKRTGPFGADPARRQYAATGPSAHGPGERELPPEWLLEEEVARDDTTSIRPPPGWRRRLTQLAVF